MCAGEHSPIFRVTQNGVGNLPSRGDRCGLFDEALGYALRSGADPEGCFLPVGSAVTPF